MSKGRVAVLMSGGVDSSVVAAILKDQGYELTGVFVEAYNEPGCPTDEDKKMALKVALQLGMPFQVMDVRREYKRAVVEYFTREYAAGRTPNPDVVCNSQIKFGLVAKRLLQEGFELVATGHYARVHARSENDELLISNTIERAEDVKKDQSYFLWRVEPEILTKVLWPLGDYQKQEVRDMAKKMGLPNFAKPDSMGVCMMGDLNVKEFLRGKIGEAEGKVLVKDWELGIHKGLWFYTVGQRVGVQELRIKNQELRKIGYDTTNLPAFYVVAKDPASNTITIGEREECNRQELRITNYELRINGGVLEEHVGAGRVFVRIRNLGELVRVQELRSNNYELRVKTEVDIFAPAPGQDAVLYLDQMIVVGGGTIV